MFNISLWGFFALNSKISTIYIYSEEVKNTWSYTSAQPCRPEELCYDGEICSEVLFDQR
jgi:hypothetical protein